MKVIIAGSRDISDVRLLEQALHESKFEITEVVCGMARGVDTLGLHWAEQNAIPVARFPANWEKYGKVAGWIRNTDMAQYAEALVAITTGSPGTKHMIKTATKKGLKVFVKYVGK